MNKASTGTVRAAFAIMMAAAVFTLCALTAECQSRPGPGPGPRPPGPKPPGQGGVAGTGSPTGDTSTVPTTATLEVELKLDPRTGQPSYLRVTGTLDKGDAWLGYSFYPENCADIVNDAVHKVVEIKKDEFKFDLPVPANCIGGKYSLAVWVSRIEKKKCAVQDCKWCKKNGFHMDGSLASREGVLVRPFGAVLDCSLQKDSEDSRDLTLCCLGRLDGPDGWMEVVFLPPDPSNDAVQARRECAQLKEGEIAKLIKVDEKQIGWAYHVGVYRKRVLKDECTIAKCASCSANGYHLETPGDTATGLLSPEDANVLSVKIERDPEGRKPPKIVTAGRLVKDDAFVLCLCRPAGAQDGSDEVIAHQSSGRTKALEGSWLMPERIAAGTFTVTLWRTKVYEKTCKVTGCRSCRKFGFHFEGGIGLCEGSYSK
jgi:hypothetical protein